MTTQVIHPTLGKNPCVDDFHMTRQPILDRHQDLLAFELSFRAAAIDSTPTDSEKKVTASVLAHFIELNMLKVIGDLRGHVNVDAEVLMSDIFQHIPRTKFVLNIPEHVTATDEILARVAQLAESGFVFSLDEVLSNSDNVQKFLPMVEIVKCDLHKLSINELVQLTPQIHFANKKLLVENVDTLAQFEACLALGFDYFQGYYFASPIIDPDKKLSPSQLAVIEVISLISTDADSAEIEECIKRDVSLGLNLLRLVNTAAVGAHRIDSLRQALMVLGRNQLLAWMQVMLYAQPRENVASVKPLLMMATTRGKLLELIAQWHKPSNRSIADTAFTVGIMSSMDALFSMPMDEILQHLAVVDEVSEALLARHGYYGDLLNLAACAEQKEETLQLQALLNKLQLSCNDFYLLQSNAFEWSNNVARAFH